MEQNKDMMERFLSEIEQANLRVFLVLKINYICNRADISFDALAYLKNYQKYLPITLMRKTTCAAENILSQQITKATRIFHEKGKPCLLIGH